MYNAQDTIVRAVKSVLNQTYSGLIEIIVINDGSIDQSVYILDDYIKKNQIKNIKIINKKNGGVSSARNTGLKIASGKWIALLDSDDRWLSEKLEKQMQVLQENIEIDFLGCGRNNEGLSILGKKIDKIHKATVKELLLKMYPQTSTVVFKRKLFEQYGGYNENMTHAEDGDLWVRYCANSNFYYIPDSLVVTGEGKPSFGYSGLSANLKAMYIGNLCIIKDAHKNKLIGTFSFYLFYLFYIMKYLRRIFLTKFR